MAKKVVVKRAAGDAVKKAEKRETIIGTKLGKSVATCGCGGLRGAASKPCEEPSEKPKKSCCNLKCCKCCSPLCIIAVIAVIAVVAIIAINPFGSGAKGEGAIIAAAIEESRTAMEATELSNSFVIDTNQYDIQTKSNGYLVTFSILGSNTSSTFGVALGKDLSLMGVGLDGETMALEAFLASQGAGPQASALQECAKRFNQNEENGPIKSLVSNFLNGTSRSRSIMTLPKTLKCNGVDYPYSLELGDGYVKTTLYNGTEGHYSKSTFATGIVVRNVTIPVEDMSAGVFVYVDRVGFDQFAYSYELKDKSIVTFDKYDPNLANAYNITSVPRLVWNCKYVLARTLASAELNGTVPQGFEERVLTILSCMYNNGLPTDVCSAVGAVPDATGHIDVQIPKEYYFSMYQTGVNLCKPDNETVKLQAFYMPNSTACLNQRPFVEQLKGAFGDHMDLQYYCVGKAEECKKYVQAGN